MEVPRTRLSPEHMLALPAPAASVVELDGQGAHSGLGPVLLPPSEKLPAPHALQELPP